MCRKLFWHIFFISFTHKKLLNVTNGLLNGNILSFVMKGFLLFLLLGKG